MGNDFTKLDPYISDKVCPQVYVDVREAGTVYFVKHKTANSVPSNEISKKTHYALSIDITGSSTKHDFCSTHYDLCIDEPTNHLTYVGCVYKKRPWDYYSEVRKVGQIPLNEIQKFYIPTYFAKDLESKLNNGVHYPMSLDNNGTKWSSLLNCQTFTRAAIQYLGFNFPSDIVIVSDCIPSMVDMYLSSRLTTAQVIAGKQETIQGLTN